MVIDPAAQLAGVAEHQLEEVSEHGFLAGTGWPGGGSECWRGCRSWWCRGCIVTGGLPWCIGGPGDGREQDFLGVRSSADQQRRPVALGIFFQMQRHHPEIERGLHRAAESQGAIQRLGKGDAGGIGNVLAHAYDKVDMLADGLGLGEGEASIQHNEANVVLENPEHLAQALGTHGPGETVFIFQQDSPGRVSVAREVNDMRLMLEQGMQQIATLDSPA